MAAPVLAAIPGAIDLAGCLSLPEAAACLARCRLFVGNDSGLMHLAAAAGSAHARPVRPHARQRVRARRPPRRRRHRAGPGRANPDRALRPSSRVRDRGEGHAVRVAHVMAGAPPGGAELFFERLVLAQHRAGDAVLPMIRRDPGPGAAAWPRRARCSCRSAACSTSPPGRGCAPPAPIRPAGGRGVDEPRRPLRAARRVGARGAARRLLRPRYYRRCDHLVGNTRALAAGSWRRAGRAAQALTCRISRPTCWRHARAARRAAGRRWCWRSAACIRNKAFDVLIRALRASARRARDHGGRGAGAGRARSAGPRRAWPTGCCSRAGGRIPRALLAGCDVLACPSRHEPLGNVVVEASPPPAPWWPPPPPARAS